MSTLFPVKILAANKSFYEGDAVSLTIPAHDGSLQILAHHENMVIATREGVVRVRVSDEEPEMIGIAGIGFAHIAHGEVTLLVDSIERPEEIDRVRAEEALARAQEQLKQDQSIQEYRVSKANVARAMQRLANSGKTIQGLGMNDEFKP